MSLVLALQTPDAIVIAGESRVSLDDGRRADTAAKVLMVGEDIFGACGEVLYDGGADAFTVARAYVGQGRPAAATADAIVADVARRLQARLAAGVRDGAVSPHAGQVPGLQLLVATRVHGRPQLAWRNVVGVVERGSVRTEELQRAAWPGPGTLIVTGQSRIVAPYVPSLPAYRTVLEAQGAAEQLMRWAMAASDRVGGAVDVAVVDGSGARWLRRQPTPAYGWTSLPRLQEAR